MSRKNAKERTISLKVSQEMYTKIENRVKEKKYKNMSQCIRDSIETGQKKDKLSRTEKQRIVKAICMLQTSMNRNGYDDEEISNILRKIKEDLN